DAVRQPPRPRGGHLAGGDGRVPRGLDGPGPAAAAGRLRREVEGLRAAVAPLRAERPGPPRRSRGGSQRRSARPRPHPGTEKPGGATAGPAVAPLGVPPPPRGATPLLPRAARTLPRSPGRGCHGPCRRPPRVAPPRRTPPAGA